MTVINNAKSCGKCFQTKPTTEFYTNATMSDGFLGKCKTCVKKEVDARHHKKIILEKPVKVADRVDLFKAYRDYHLSP